MQYIRIRNLREDMDMTQTDMAKNLFISQRTYSYYESGGHDIPTEVLVRLADFMTSRWIIFSTGRTSVRSTDKKPHFQNL